MTATMPPEARGISRDGVRLAVVTPSGTTHTVARDLPSYLSPGDVLVINTSATLPSALPGLHVSTSLDDGSWVVELRQPSNAGPAVPVPGEVLPLPGGVLLRIVEPHPPGQARLWRAIPSPQVDRVPYLEEWGRPIHYRYVTGSWPIDALQNVYAIHPGSAEMPSAGRPLTAAVLVRLLANGVTIAPLVLHTGVASQEKHEPPQTEEYAVPAATARLVNSARRTGRRVVAVGTTVVRALESAAFNGRVVPSAGWTSLVLGPSRPATVVDGLLTGLHEPEASHLDLLRAVAGGSLVTRGYADLTPDYLWHEFGDSMLLLP
ncbi:MULTISPECIES: S-adenosylmethionine:tRNA ribosyltransferase-isomerase [unclassified Nocardioides]|uniref:S-adenosylmethionine:tRNA ribosyltransferase-isomerase n=1 Tax=Nocardioides sp. URHA0032 TaxID=1380388 RepID=UPI000490CB6C|nr:S-adenosylmethionine:tRNA ribosyltransferase-isomerase [Nocardioides sp. URHA0032]